MQQTCNHHPPAGSSTEQTPWVTGLNHALWSFSFGTGLFQP
jgi:hypothetical protein